MILQHLQNDTPCVVVKNSGGQFRSVLRPSLNLTTTPIDLSNRQISLRCRVALQTADSLLPVFAQRTGGTGVADLLLQAWEVRWNIESKFVIDTFTEFATKPEDGQPVTPEDSFEARLMPRCTITAPL